MLEGIEQCGFAGMSEQQCIEEWSCCFDPTSQISCFKPKPVNNGVSAGITAGAAVGAFLACVGIAFGGFMYWRNYGFHLPSTPVTESFASPLSNTETA